MGLAGSTLCCLKRYIDWFVWVYSSVACWPCYAAQLASLSEPAPPKPASEPATTHSTSEPPTTEPASKPTSPGVEY